MTLAFTLNAQEKKHVVKLNLLSPIVKTGNLAYEYVLNEKVGLQMRGYFTAANIDDQKTNGFGIIPEVRFYLSDDKTAPVGFFVAPFVRYGNMKMEVEIDDFGNKTTEKATTTSYGGGLIVGTQKVYSNLITFEAFVGVQYMSANVEVDEGNEASFDTDKVDGFLPRGGITIGILF